MLYEDAMRSPVVMKLEAARLGKCYDALEARLSTPLENRDYLLTSGFSAADVSVGQAVYMARHFAKLEAHPAVTEWFDRITERPEFQKSLPRAGTGLYSQDFYPAWEAAG
jgi:glutathione S-transferase